MINDNRYVYLTGSKHDTGRFGRKCAARAKMQSAVGYQPPGRDSPALTTRVPPAVTGRKGRTGKGEPAKSEKGPGGGVSPFSVVRPLQKSYSGFVSIVRNLVLVFFLCFDFSLVRVILYG